MNNLILILLLFIAEVTSAQSSTPTVYNQVHLLSEEFLKAPFIRIAHDSIAFTQTQNSIIVAQSAWTEDSATIYVYYRDQAFNDFWELYCRNKYDQGWTGRREHDETPKKFINEYFNDKNIPLYVVLIYKSEIGHKGFYACGKCYQGIDFLFKINKKDYDKLCLETGIKLEKLQTNYR